MPAGVQKCRHGSHLTPGINKDTSSQCSSINSNLHQKASELAKQVSVFSLNLLLNKISNYSKYKDESECGIGYMLTNVIRSARFG